MTIRSSGCAALCSSAVALALLAVLAEPEALDSSADRWPAIVVAGSAGALAAAGPPGATPTGAAGADESVTPATLAPDAPDETDPAWRASADVSAVVLPEPP